MLEKRIYLVSIGLQSDWIIKSIKELRPDFVYFLEDKNEKHEGYFKAKKEVIKDLKKKDISSTELKYSKEEEYQVLKSLKEIIQKHPKDKIFLNLCSGDRKIPSMFIISSFIFSSINPKIYVVYFDSKSEEILEFPSFKVRLPEDKLISVLREINSIGEFCTKKKLQDSLVNKKILKSDKNQNVLMSMNRRYIQKLIDWNFIKIEGRGKNSIISITEEGEKWLKFM